MPLYQNKQLAFLHAIASPYRERSHFDAQNLLENGTLKTGGTEGWLNRALVALGAGDGGAMAINQQVPLVLQGALQVGSWTPKGAKWKGDSDYMHKMGALYSHDTLLASAFAEGVKAQEMVESSLPADDMQAGGKAKGSAQFYEAAKAAATFLTKEDGPRVAVLEASGWDTHAAQGTSHGALANRLADLANGLAVLPQALGPVWNKTVVCVVTEFGRTVRVNGTKGTDHGTASMAMVMGGGVRGGRVLGQWPGLNNGALYQGRDLMPTTDMRSLFRTVLYSHLHTPADVLGSIVFPESDSAGYLQGLFA